MLLSLNDDSPEPEQVVVSQFKVVRGILTEVRHDLIKNRCYRVLHLQDVEVEYENILDGD
jgi:hypothetical protein